jgi:23S rRNA (cytosine1962-C5)-methyltransferase
LDAIRVNRRAAERVRDGHPWIFQSDIIDAGHAAPGAAVEVLDPRARPVGVFHYSSRSQISLRRLADPGHPIDRAFYREKIAAAIAYRQRVAPGQTHRLVHAEGDGLPALIVDRYGECLSVQLLNQGMDAARADILSVLQELVQPQAIVLRNDVSVRKLEGLPLEKELVHGELPSPHEVHLNGFRWRVDLLGGQKTGTFLDQRENYVAAQRFARGSVLDCFCSSGGFALHLARASQRVEAVDASAGALDRARENATLNQIENVEFREADVFELLSQYAQTGRRFDTVVLDPPAFAKSRNTVQKALAGYKDINLRALRLLSSGGVLVTCSCSHHVSEGAFLETLAAAAIDAGRTLRVLDRRTQSLDHPILLTVPETHYLKCIIVEVV